MIILIDFENTHASGFEGYEYLSSQDTLVVYYSDEKSYLPLGMIEDLKEKKVHVRMVKLLKAHQNALDMYIASTTGMYLDSGEKICIVSKDKGYASVADFWHSLRNAEILLGETIKECLLNSKNNDEDRIVLCKKRSQKMLLTNAFDTMNTVPTKPHLSKVNMKLIEKARKDTEIKEEEILPNPLLVEAIGIKQTEEAENSEEFKNPQKPENDSGSEKTRKPENGSGSEKTKILEKSDNEKSEDEKSQTLNPSANDSDLKPKDELLKEKPQRKRNYRRRRPAKKDNPSGQNDNIQGQNDNIQGQNDNIQGQNDN